MVTVSVLVTSILLQFVAAILSLRLMRVTGWGVAWVLIAAAFTLMGVRRSISLYRQVEGGVVKTDFSAELVALLISTLLVAGVALIGPLFRAAARARESEEKAQILERHFLDAIESMPEGFVLYDSDRRLVHCNTRFKEIYGYSNEEAAPGTSAEALGQLDIERNIIDLNNDLERETYLYRRRGEEADINFFDIRLRDGHWLESRDFLTADGGVISIQTDVTERKLAENEMRRTQETLERRVKERTRELEVARREAESASRYKSMFLANMSHELRNPLNALLGFAAVMKVKGQGGMPRDQYETYLDNIEESGRHLNDLISDILDISAIEQNKLEIADRNMDIAAVVGRAVDFMRSRAERARVRLVEKNISENLPAFRGDERRIKQVLLNLIGNAVKFTPEGGEVRVDCVRNPKGDLVISVEDTGMGISRENMATVLAPFGQIREFTGGQQEGAGLGLPLSHELVSLHDGKFQIDSVPGDGTRVVMTFPTNRFARADVPASHRGDDANGE